MVFSSVTFVFVFLPCFLLLYFLLPHRLRNGYLFFSSLLFYTWGEQMLVLVMLTSTLVDYVAGLVISTDFPADVRDGSAPAPKGRTRRQRAALTASIVVNLLMLGVFKYFNFGMENFNALMWRLGLHALVARDVMTVVLPLGISFYTFQSMSYTIDVYRGQVKAARSFIDFACFVTMFPQLVAGPIVRYRDVESHLVHRTTSMGDFAAGVRQFIVGLGKKMLIANVVAEPVDAIFALPHDQVSAAIAWAGGTLFMLQLYYDFAGYSDMAIGMGRMLGFRFPINFRYPYIAKTLTEFWTRWHITLSTWLRDYLFVALGGYRVSRPRAYLNLFIVFVACGIWHGASWNFVLFGLIQAGIIVGERMVKANRRWFFTGFLGHIYLLWVVVVNMVIFRAEDIATAGVFLGRMFGVLRPVESLYPVGFFISPEAVLVILVGVIGSLPVVPWIQRKQGEWTARKEGSAAWVRGIVAYSSTAACMCLVLLLCAMKLAAGTYNPFIYFRF